MCRFRSSPKTKMIEDEKDLSGTIAVHRMKRLDFGNQMATFPDATNFGSNPGPTLSPHGSTIPLAATSL